MGRYVVGMEHLRRLIILCEKSQAAKTRRFLRERVAHAQSGQIVLPPIPLNPCLHVDNSPWFDLIASEYPSYKQISHGLTPVLPVHGNDGTASEASIDGCY